MKEIWKFWRDVKRTNQFMKKGDRLFVSNMGRCRVNDKVVEPSYHLGYKNFGHERLHRIVYELFVGKIPDGYEIDHINTIRSDNRVSNLRSVTHKENCNNTLTLKKNSGENGYWFGKTCEKHSKSKPICQIDLETGEIIRTWSCAAEAKRQLGIAKGSISACCKGKRKSAGGYIWRYVNSESLM